jgi:DNA-binding transcriptional ArsR family regulator
MDPTPLPVIFGALSDPTRLAIVERLLADGERSVGDLARPFAMSLPAISRHLRVLESVGLIERRTEKQWRYCRARPEAIRMVDDWMARYRRYWDGALDRLQRLLTEEQEASPAPSLPSQPKEVADE